MFLACASSGGTRLQEGTANFVALSTIIRAVAAHRAAGNAHIVYLHDPSMGGTLTSWAGLGQVTFAEPGARIGLLGPLAVAMLGGPDLSAAQRGEPLRTEA
jgi:acyl-CoA carboxylase subunit beta